MKAEAAAALEEIYRDLEEELSGFTTYGYTGDHSPNRADAMIWAMSDLFPELTKAPEIGERPDLAARVPSRPLRKIQPERAAGRRIEMPVDDFTGPRVERLPFGVRRAIGCRVTGWRCGHQTVV